MTTRRRFTRNAIGASGYALASGSMAGGSDESLAKAMEALRDAIPKAEADAARPAYHFHAPANWTNDPNGTLFYKGWHHLFYQLNPFSARMGSQHWGHAQSRDLVNWEHLPIAIAPSGDKGERAIFSGGAIIAADGRPRILYTSIGHPQPEQWMTLPKDDELLAWEKFPGNPVLTQGAHLGGRVNQWRDPFLFREAGRVYMVCGGSMDGDRGGAGQVQLYVATKADLSEWKHLGAVFRAMNRETFNIECPNLFKLDGRWVLIISPSRPCEYFVGDLDLEKVRFTPETHGILDPGDAYASNISRDDKGRTILWLWGRTLTNPDRGWNSVMVMPRILSIGSDAFLRQQAAPEFESLRGRAVQFPQFSPGEEPRGLEGIPNNSVEIEAQLTPGRFGEVGFELRQPSADTPVTEIAIGRGALRVGSRRAYIGRSGSYRVRFFIDRSCLEVYVDDGVAAVYSALEPDSILQIAMFGRSGSPPSSGFAPRRATESAPDFRIESVRAWPMKPARFDLARFQFKEK